MKGSIFKWVFLSATVVVVMNYLEYQKSGVLPAYEWVAKIQSLVIPTVKKTANKLVGEQSTESKNRVKVSKWIDANGVVHYENRPVAGAQTLEVDPNENFLPQSPVVELPKPEESKAKTTEAELRSIQEAKKAHFEALIQ
jgi:hypothetical protein